MKNRKVIGAACAAALAVGLIGTAAVPAAAAGPDTTYIVLAHQIVQIAQGLAGMAGAAVEGAVDRRLQGRLVQAPRQAVAQHVIDAAADIVEDLPVGRRETHHPEGVIDGLVVSMPLLFQLPNHRLHVVDHCVRRARQVANERRARDIQLGDHLLLNGVAQERVR